jgi:Kef-type K+ transport system membrane component KefB
MLDAIPPATAMPLVILLAWVAGELGVRSLRLPRISAYALVGFAMAADQLGVLPPPSAEDFLLLANIAFGLILFEAGYRMNLGWLRANPWIAATSVLESTLSFAAVYLLCAASGVDKTTSLLLASLAMATSPATVLRVINEQRASGQVTERALHLSVLNCVLCVLAFKVVVGVAVLESSGDLLQAASSSVLVLVASAACGAVAGVALSSILRELQRATEDSTLAFAVVVVGLVALTHTLKLSPVLATLTLGLVARRTQLFASAAQRGFGSLGDLLSVFLFVFVASTLQWQHVLSGLALGLGIIGVRALAKLAGVGLLAQASGSTWRKGALTGLALTPISAFVILVLEQTRHLGVDMVDRLAPLAAVALLLEVTGPMATQWALTWARETRRTDGG